MLFAVFYVFLRRAKPLLKRDVPIKTRERDVYIIATASLETELSFVYKRIREKCNANRQENRWEKTWWKKVDLFDKSVYLSVRDVFRVQSYTQFLGKR